MDNRPRSDSGLVTTAWVAEHLTDPHVVLVEASHDPSLYPVGHIAGAVNWSAEALLAAPVVRPHRFRAAMERLLAAGGIDNYSTVVLYGSAGSLLAARALWLLALCGHPDVRLLDGGRDRWVVEGRPVSVHPAQRVAATYRAAADAGGARAVCRDLRRSAPGRAFVDAGTGDGVKPGAIRIPWSATVNHDRTFKSAVALESLFAAHGVTRAHHVVTCSADAAASAHIWFALSRVLGFPHVRNYESA
jgi:thiosulfate/3-mercaptopyruvate sulfurtransferase